MQLNIDESLQLNLRQINKVGKICLYYGTFACVLILVLMYLGFLVPSSELLSAVSNCCGTNTDSDSVGTPEQVSAILQCSYTSTVLTLK